MSGGATLTPQSTASVTTVEPVSISAEVVCPSCGAIITSRLRVVIESMRRAARRPITPELLVVCAGCGSLFVVSLRPEAGR